jgi:hypothetical protein
VNWYDGSAWLAFARRTSSPKHETPALHQDLRLDLCQPGERFLESLSKDEAFLPRAARPLEMVVLSDVIELPPCTPSLLSPLYRFFPFMLLTCAVLNYD